MFNSRGTLLYSLVFYGILLLVSDSKSQQAIDTGAINRDVRDIRINDPPNGTYICSDKPNPMAPTDKSILIKSGTKSCSILTGTGVTFFGLKTDGLVTSHLNFIDIVGTGKNVNGSFSPGYLLFWYQNQTISFNFDTPSTSDITLEFLRNPSNVTFSFSVKTDLQIRLFGFESQAKKGEKLFDAVMSKNIENHGHVIILGSLLQFGHYLMTSQPLQVPIKVDQSSTGVIAIKFSPVLPECSKYFALDAPEKSQEINGPTNPPSEGYSCLNLFEATFNAKEAHFDVDFANFITFQNSEDILTLNDGKNSLTIGMADSHDYEKRLINFETKFLSVLYESPGPFQPTRVSFKITVRSKASGGLVTTDRALVLPSSGSSLYTLIPQAGKVASLNFKKLTGVQMVLWDDMNKKIRLGDKLVLPPSIVAGRPDSKIYLNISTVGKVNGDLTFSSLDKSTTCGGIFYESAGVMSVKSAQTKTCSWLLGAERSLLNIDYQAMIPEGCLEIRQLSQSSPVYKKCNVSLDVILPKFQLEPSHVKVTLGQNTTEFEASLSRVVPTFNWIEQSNQKNITSVGFPINYHWSSQSDTFTLNGVKKSMFISIATLDLRQGEKLLINNKEASNDLTSSYDYDISNTTATLSLKRSSSTDDFSYHKGFKIVASEFEKYIVADMTKDTVNTPKNLKSVLIKIQGSSNKRISYNVSLSGPEQDYYMSVIDSRTLVGRQVYEEEKVIGSTTSDTLLVSVTSKKGASIPALGIQYKQLDCNTTIDHICDNSSRCVPAEKLCKGKVYCQDKSDSKLLCSSGPVPIPPPSPVYKGVGGFTVFVLCVLMFTFGALATLYGPDLYKNMEGRLRSGRYTTFSSTE